MTSLVRSQRLVPGPRAPGPGRLRLARAACARRQQPGLPLSVAFLGQPGRRCWLPGQGQQTYRFYYSILIIVSGPKLATPAVPGTPSESTTST